MSLVINSSFTKTKAYREIKKFLLKINVQILREKQTESESVVSLLKNVKSIMENIPLKEKGRFANTALVDFYKELKGIDTGFENEIYFKSSFGNESRLDYGTGHEMNFLCFLKCLVDQNDMKLNEVFYTLKEYFRIIRFFIKKFDVEPAGSKGTWGLDDYQLLPFILGSGELLGNSISFTELMDNKEYCFGEALSYVIEVKGRDLSVYSPLLYSYKDYEWDKVNLELLKMYDESIFRSKVVNQHFIYTDNLSNEEIE
ncbi:phosphotyrosyl phosphatase activator [Tubulinosema ratisbonensis]|uniref:Serine/threonine-protein phosphatase 2A activator n=1 Tax=Tubulinosema ratisbonensis TaxID=291195 RepID=A0A437AIE6_9MICR|nr:phosphotyrosyl phosphatase activator [Tubulinosema ratisbonensis]